MAYGDGDATFRACGGETGLQRLVEAFYARMDTLPEARRIRSLHPPDLAVSVDKLSRFLCGWTGGPKRYSEKFGSIRIPEFHAPLPVDEAERDAWLACMRLALDDCDFPADLRHYLLEQLYVPAERIRLASQARRARGRDEAQTASATEGHENAPAKGRLDA